MLLRSALLAGAALAVAAADLLVKAALPTTALDFHPRSHAWTLLALGFLLALAALAALPSRLVALASGLTAGGVAGNVASAARHGGSVQNPLVAGGYAFNLADVVLLAAVPLLMVAAARVAIVHRATIDRLIPPRRWEVALRRRLGL